MSISQDAITYFNHGYLDTSQISALNLGTDLVDYKVDTQQVNLFLNKGNKQDIFISEMVQSRRQNQITWSINSLDLILGLVGGFTSIIWGTLGMILAPYEDFKF